MAFCFPVPRVPFSGVVVYLAASCAVACGCSGQPARVMQPKYAVDAGAGAVAAYDRDGDQAISGDELKQVPGVLAALASIDTNDDGRVTAQEIDARVQAWRDSKTAEMSVLCRVTLNGEPLVGAQVEFQPEAFLGPAIHPATGVTGEDGAAGISLAEEHRSDRRHPAVACGWYQVRIRGTASALPPQYNDKTTLGCEVSPNADWVYEPGEIVFELVSPAI